MKNWGRSEEVTVGRRSGHGVMLPYLVATRPAGIELTAFDFFGGARPRIDLVCQGFDSEGSTGWFDVVKKALRLPATPTFGSGRI
jgi:hypothetical protein